MSAHIPCYADIALPVGVDKTFTYLIPHDLQQAAVVGVRAIVPFGRKYATGLIVGLPASTTVSPLKPIRDILDPSPVIPDELLRLCAWTAEYYFAPLGEVLRAAIPYGFTAASKRLVRVSPSAPGGLSEKSVKRAPARTKLLSILSQSGPLSVSQLQKKVRIRHIHSLLNEMEGSGYIVSEEVLKLPKQSLQTRQFVLLDRVNSSQLSAAGDALSPRMKRARQVLVTIQSLTENGIREVALADLLKESGASSDALRPFLTSGLIRIERREVSTQHVYGIEEQTLSIVLNASQQHALQRINNALDVGLHRTFLLHGVTGSGKTQVYIEAMRRCLQYNKTAIILVPEISLTPQTVRRFRSHFGDRVAVVHSQMSGNERHDVWRRALRGDCAIVVGPRSAVFAPLPRLGLFVVDEEHDASYKQYDAIPRYNARDVAIVRASHINAVVVLGTATPSAESYFNATNGKYELLTMPHRIDEVPMPSISVVDMTAERRAEYAALRESLPEEKRRKLREFQQSSFSALLREKIADRLSRKEGIILLQNRRGFAPFVECVDCGYAETCANCSITLTYHLAKKHLRCHYCGSVRDPNAQCPQCGGTNMHMRGIGTQRVEEELARLFPMANVLRLDLDTVSRKGAHDRLLRKFGGGEAEILLGTQMVAKGLDFPRVTLVGVISADTQLLLPDFRSSERTFQLLTQVGGRAGRSALGGEVVIQTHQPRNYTLQHVVDHDFKAFYEQELHARRELAYPPFARLALIEAKGENEAAVRQESERFARLLRPLAGTFDVLGPSPAVIARIKNQYRWHIIVKSRKTRDQSGSLLRQALRTAMAGFSQNARRSVRVTIDCDPVGLM